MAEKPLISIIVPTKNRYACLKNLVLSFSDFKQESLDLIEIIIQDNSTCQDKEFLNLLQKIKLPSLKYSYTPNSIPIKENSDLAVLNSKGKYLCYIGDDDGVTEIIVDCVKWMQAENIDVVVPKIVNYYWPEYIDGLSGKLSGSLTYSPFTFSYSKIDPINSLYESINNGFRNRGNLPLLYHGIVSRENLEKIYSACGTFFPGPSPDIANGVALALNCSKYYTIDAPIVISGASKNHGGGVRTRQDRTRTISSLEFLPQDTEKYWEKDIPKRWCGETIWPESAIKALRSLNRNDLVKQVDFELINLHFASKNIKYVKLASRNSKNKLKFYVKLILILTSDIMNFLLRVYNRKVKLSNNGKSIIHNIENIQEAILHFKCIEFEILKEEA